MLEHKRYSEKRHKKELKRRKLRAYKKKVLPEIYQREREAKRKAILRNQSRIGLNGPEMPKVEFVV